MRKFLSFLKAVLRRASQGFRIRHLLFLIILIALISGGKYLWKERLITKDPSTQALSLSPPSPEIKNPLDKEPQKEDGVGEAEESGEEEEETDEEESEPEENTSRNDSPWTLLKTTLAPRYYEPTVKTQTPSVALILTGLGLNKAWTDHILTTVKKKITLAFSPYSPNLNNQLQYATSLGYQSLIVLPMEPYSYPNPDPGPYAVLTGDKAEENVKKIKLILEKTPKGTAVMGEYGSRFTSSQADLGPVLTEIKNQGSLYIDPNTTLHSHVQKTCKTLDMTCHQVDLTLPLVATLAQGDDFFKKIIQNAKENGIVIISIPAIPAFVDHLLEWIDSLEKSGINLVTIAELKTPELSLGTPTEDQSAREQQNIREHQGTTDANKQDSHQPR